MRDLEELRRLREWIQASLKDSEEREVPDESERLHLSELRDIALDADDVLDEWDYKLLRARVEEGGAHKRTRGGEATDRAVCLLAAQAGEVTRRFRRARGEFRALNFTVGEGVRRPRPRGWAPSSSLVDERYVSDRDKDALVGYMLSDDCARSDQLSVIPIVGMALAGKTTLALLIYNDPKVGEAFSLMVWVSLTRNDDLEKVLNRVLESLTRQTCCGDQLDTIQGPLRQSLKGKRFLLVLDDVYCEHRRFLDQFKDSFSSGSRGSVVLLTTMVGEIAEMMKMPAALYLFKRRPDGYCWSTFKRYAFNGQDSVEGVDMEDARRMVVEKCDGMPSLAKLLGVSFRNRFDSPPWKDFVEFGLVDEILPALQPMYLLLPSHLKPCVLYCSLFPKGYLFNKALLVRLWMAQGLILPKNQKFPEDIGIQYFNELISRSFFLQSETDEQAYFMHNLICDLVYFISRNEHSRVVEMHNLPQKCRHLSLVPHECRSVTSFYHQYSSLRSFLVMQRLPSSSIMHIEIQNDMFLQLIRLRSLDLSYTDIHELPDTIGNLKHLRFLALNCTQIKRLPETMDTLYNLQTLELRGCPYLRELPRAMTCLINLRHLDMENSYYLVRMPLQIGNLTSLQKLPTFNLQKGNEFCGIRELQELSNLRELGIYGLCNVTNLEDAKKANMQKKTHLKILKLIWSSNDVSPLSEQFGDHVDQNFFNTADETDEEDEKNDYDNKNASNSVNKQCTDHEKPCSCDMDDEPLRVVEIQDEQESNFSSILSRTVTSNQGIQDSISSDAAVSEKDLLGSLHPSISLEKLCIQSYGGAIFPDWIGDASFDKLMCVELTDCKCVVLPSLGQLPYLRFLSIDGMPVELVGTEFCGSGNPKAFPKVETLSFHNMNKWKSWDGVKEGDFPELNKLSLLNCPELRRVPLFSSLKILQVDRCAKLNDIPDLPSLEVLDIYYCDASFVKLMCVELTDCKCVVLPSLGQLPSLRFLSIDGMPVELVGTEFCGSGNPRAFPKLETLSFDNMNKWKSWDGVKEDDFPKLNKLSLFNCPELRRVPLFSSLKILQVDRCAQLNDIPELPSLEVLDIYYCDALATLPTLVSLCSLTIMYCQKLKSLPPLKKLKKLSFEKCE